MPIHKIEQLNSLMPSQPVTDRQVPSARISAVATHLPSNILDNAALAESFETWSAEKIAEKTGIVERRIADEGETALDLGCKACEELFARHEIDRQDIDFLIFCTQAPDHILPTSACIMQDRLGLPKSIGAFDYNLGCSGWVYGTSIAAGLIASGVAQRVLLVTADTYSKYIHPKDRSVKTLFGDGASATLIEASTDQDARIGPFVFGTDGSGAGSLIVPAGGFRQPRDEASGQEKEDRTGNIRSQDNLYMDGAAVLSFTLREVPRALETLLDKTGTSEADYDHIVLHQANKFMIDALQKKMGLSNEKVPRYFENIGNTVSSTIPFVLSDLMDQGRIGAGTRICAIGFGVGLSWAAASIVF